MTAPAPGATARSRRVLALYGTAAVVLALDQLTKHLVVSNLAGRPPVDLIGDVVQFRYTTNSGGAFSLLTGNAVLRQSQLCAFCAYELAF